jgi:hypothetical protein
MSADPIATTAPPAPAGNAVYWQPHIQAWKASGLSARRFCQEQSLPYGRFLYWMHKQSDHESSKTSTSAFTRVVPVSGSGPRGLTIHLPGGIEIGGIDADNVVLLQRILAQL